MANPTVACFGELLLRLSEPAAQPLMHSNHFNWHVGGAEANVAAGLSHLGLSSRFISTVANNPLGDGALAELRSHGVNTDFVTRADGRMGLYFHTAGAGPRAGAITYDRQYSAFALSSFDKAQATRCLSDASWLHISGVTPAVGEQAAEAACRYAETAASLDIGVSFDFNHRAKMWALWDADPEPYLRRIIQCTTLMFGNDHDLGMVLPLPPSARGRHLQQAHTAFESFPRLQAVACAPRQAHSAQRHSLVGHIVTRTGQADADPVTIDPVIDRIGAGDAFSAGIIAGWLRKDDEQTTVNNAMAAAVHKHTVIGDLPCAGPADIAAIRDQRSADVSR